MRRPRATGTARAHRIVTAELFAEEERDDLPLVNRLRDDVSRGVKRAIVAPRP